MDAFHDFRLSEGPLVIDDDSWMLVPEPDGAPMWQHLNHGLRLTAWLAPELGGAVVNIQSGTAPDPLFEDDAVLVALTPSRLDRLIADLSTIRAAMPDAPAVAVPSVMSVGTAPAGCAHHSVTDQDVPA